MIPVGLTIAGSDSGGGAGIQADIKAMQANGVYAASVITAVTAQNTKEVAAAHDLPTKLIGQQIDAVADDFSLDVVKTGMLSSAAIIELVAEKVEEHELLPLVVDPVMISKSGFSLLQPEAIESLKTRMLPLATVVTPNAHEAEKLADMPVESVDQARKAAERIYAMGPEAVLVKGGHLLHEREAVDVLYDGKRFETFTAPYIDTPHTHGTGCTYASAIAAQLAHRRSLPAAIGKAKQYVTKAIKNGLAIGGGHGPTHHFYFLEDLPKGVR